MVVGLENPHPQRPAARHPGCKPRLVLLYWQIGREILARQAEQGWGAKAIERLAHVLRTAFPEMEGLSARSVKRMLAFCREYASLAFVQEPLAQMGAEEKVQQTV